MSFSQDVKDELVSKLPSARHCQIAELTALICAIGKIEIDHERKLKITFDIENEAIIRKCSALLEKIFDFPSIDNSKQAYKVLETVKLLYLVESVLKRKRKVVDEKDLIWDGLVLQQNCCKRAFLRGLFLATGSVNNPEKAYHLEMVFLSETFAMGVCSLLKDMQLEGKLVQRKKYYVVYIKDGSMIVDFLNNIGAPLSLMEMENIRIIKDVRNGINRRVNCETSNIHKTVSAARKQIEDIELIERTIGIKSLPANLRQMAELRLEEPDATLQELGELLNPPVTKSGVNHRLRKISQIAAELENDKSAKGATT